MFDELFTVLFSIGESSCGRSYRIWGVTPSNDSTWKREFAPTKLDLKVAISSVALPTTLENLNVPMPSMPSTEPSNFGKQNPYVDLPLFVLLGSCRRPGRKTPRPCSPHRYTLPDTTVFPCNHHLRASFSPSSPRYWTAFATTKSTLQDGPQMRLPHVPVPLCEAT